MTNPNQARVVITGLGAVSPLGLTAVALWDGLLAGRSGIARITQFDPAALPCQIAGEVKDFDPKNYIDGREARRMARCAQFAVAATREALADAGLPDRFAEPDRAAVLIGTGIGGVEKVEEMLGVHRQRGYDKINPFLLPNALCNLPAHHISKTFQTLGPLNTVVTARGGGPCIL
jgi:3-oxoacyl-[acyl-carrier-protein] synthase II